MATRSLPRKEGSLKTMIIVLLSVIMISCSDRKSSSAPDMTPIGDGLKTIGYGIIGGAVVRSCVRLF